MSKVAVYTKNGCPQCDMTKMVLNGEGIEFQVFNVEEDEQAFDYVVNTLNLRQMPVVVVEGREPFSGFQPDKLKALVMKC
ncbi:glutaredoxin domain-containing protein [Heyndrickxia acidicola]|uniref:Glutaredoxin domain-containing protein n=1 Tax=Heyndrickxia acidicola TaxID=209389 RepID=A0ABU6MGJ3_9BACI|nr:glutaredoxin domain-containing protein [Heyndrickxia acidicola]MED1203544.1 glutaredoxin domain-containing protein [Heyndrickxia acidicola]